MVTLSDKRMYQMGDEELDDENMVYTEDDVKESIRRIKKKIEDELQINTVRQEKREPINIVFDAIDEEMGRDLI